MKLTDLEPRFLRWERRELGAPTDSPRATEVIWHHVDSLAEAQGILFLCPKCFVANGGRVGTHSVVCWSRSRGVPDDATPGPGRWTLEGTGFHDLTLNGDGGSRSVLLTGGGCAWHGFVTNGEVTDA